MLEPNEYTITPITVRHKLLPQYDRETVTDALFLCLEDYLRKHDLLTITEEGDELVITMFAAKPNI